MASTRVLVVESEDDVRGVIAGFLQRKGFMVQAVADGTAARAVLAGPPPDVVVLRVTLADGSAPALVRAIGGLEPPTPALVLTGSKANAEEFTQRVSAEHALYLFKPFGGNELLRAVESAVAQRAARLQVAGAARLAAAPPADELSAFDDDFGSLLGEAPVQRTAGNDGPWPGPPVGHAPPSLGPQGHAPQGAAMPARAEAAESAWPPPPPPRSPSPPLPPPVVGTAVPPSVAFSGAASGPIPLLGPPPLREALAAPALVEPPDDSVEGDWTDFGRAERSMAGPAGPPAEALDDGGADRWGRPPEGGDDASVWDLGATGDPLVDEPLEGMGDDLVRATGELGTSRPSADLAGFDDLLGGGLGEDVRFGTGQPGAPMAHPGVVRDAASVDEVEAPSQPPVEDERALRLQPMVADEAHDPRGIYGEVRLAEVLVRCQRDQFTGRLVLLRGPIRKTVRLVDGRLVGGSSNLRGESLRAVLLERRWVTAEVLRAHPVADNALLAVLVGAGHLTSAQAAAAEQARLIGAVLEAFGWSGGQYGLVYDPAVADRVHGDPVEVGPLVMRGLLDATPIAPVVRYFDQRVRESARTTLRFEAESVGLGLDPDLLRFAQTFDGRRTLSELLALSPVGIEATFRLLRGLEVLGCLSFGPLGAPASEGESPRLITGRPSPAQAQAHSQAQAHRPLSTGIPLERLDDFDPDWVETGFRAIATSVGPAVAAAEHPRWETGAAAAQASPSVPPRSDDRASANPAAASRAAARPGIYRSGPSRSVGPAQVAPAAGPRRPDSAAPRRPETAAPRRATSASDEGESRRPGAARAEGATAGATRSAATASGTAAPGPGTAAPRPSAATVAPRPGAARAAAQPTESPREGRAATPTAAAPLSPARLRSLLEAKHAGLGTLDHYTLLEVPHEATPEEVGAAYRRLSRDIHQAATHEPKLFDKATEVGRRLAEAAQVLSDRRKRAHYDAVTLGNLAGPALETDVAGAAAAFGRGKACLDRRDLPEAYEHFDRAMRLDAGPPLYRMYAAFARFRLSFPKHRKAAVEAHEALKAALLDDGTQDEGFVLMAQIYRETANNDMAARFYRKALSINRNNRLAQEGMVSLGLGEELQSAGVFGRLFGRKP